MARRTQAGTSRGRALTFAGAFTAGPGAWAPLVQSGSFLKRSDLVLQLVSRKGTKTVHGETAAKPSFNLASLITGELAPGLTLSLLPGNPP